MIKIDTQATLTDEQERAMCAIDEFMVDPRRQVFNLHGLAGTGKTTVLRHVALQYKHAALCSITGKAASVLRRKTGINACTLHSFFYRLVDQENRRGRDVLHFERRHGCGELCGKTGAGGRKLDGSQQYRPGPSEHRRQGGRMR